MGVIQNQKFLSMFMRYFCMYRECPKQKTQHVLYVATCPSKLYAHILWKQAKKLH
jgi:hypothetical protein